MSLTNPTPGEAAEPALAALYQFAQAACPLIDAFQPDLLVSLAHSDMGPLHAVQTCWAMHHAQPLPPVVRINVGVEKQSVYEEWRLANHMDGFDMRMASTPDYHHCQAWFQQNQRYREEFLAMANAVVGEDFSPRRVLILDEISHGDTRAIAFGLLSGIYPGAELRFCAGVQDWSNALGEDWLWHIAPTVWEELQASKIEDRARRRFPTDLHEHLKQVVVGSEDIEPDSLNWRPTQADSADVQALVQAGVAAEDCLGCAVWVRERIADDHRARHKSGQFAAGAQPADDEAPMKSWTFQRKDALWMEIWTHNGVTLRRWAEICGISTGQARMAIRKEWQYLHNIQPSGFGAATRYRVHAMYLPDLSEAEAKTKSIFLELNDGQILAQGYPGWCFQEQALIDAQVQVIIDLTTTPFAPPDQIYAPNRNPDWTHASYHAAFLESAARAGLSVSIFHHPVQPYGVPTIAEMRVILDRIDAAVTNDQKLLVHDRDGHERVGMVLGCWLVRHGLSARAALGLLQAQLQHSFIRGYRIPGTQGQARFVKHWKQEE